MVGAYGFLHPIIPPCPTAEEYRRRSEEWQKRSETLQDRLRIAYQALEDAEMDLDRLYDYLQSCECCQRELMDGRRPVHRNRTDNDDDDDEHLQDDEHDDTMNDDDNNSNNVNNRLRHEHVRGASHTEKDDREARHGSTRTKRRWRREQIRSGNEF